MIYVTLLVPKRGSLSERPRAIFVRHLPTVTYAKSAHRLFRRDSCVVSAMAYHWLYMCMGRSCITWGGPLALEDHFITPSTRSHKRFIPPSFEDFLLELFHDLQSRAPSPRPRSGTKRARDRAEPSKPASDIGTNDCPTPGCPAFAQCSGITL